MRPVRFAPLLAALLLTTCRQSLPEPEPAPPPEPPSWVEMVPNGRLPMDGVLTGGQPSPEQLETLAANGLRTVINLRPADESGVEGEPEKVGELGMSYLSIPVAGADGVTEENALSLAAALEEAERPVLLHCASGNRVGALLALMAYHLEGQSPEEALELGRAAGLTRLEPVVREKLGAGPPDAAEPAAEGG